MFIIIYIQYVQTEENLIVNRISFRGMFTPFIDVIFMYIW